MTALCSGKICTIFPEKGALNFWKACTIALEYSCSFIFLLLSKTFSIICLSTSYLFLLFFVIHSLNCFFMIFLFLLYVFCVDNISYIYSKKEHPPVITTNGCFSSLYILFSLLYLDQYFLIHTHSDVTLQSFLQYRDLNHFLQPFYF